MDIIQTALKRFNDAQRVYDRQRAEAREDLLFVAGNQWTDQAPAGDFRLTVNLLGPFLRQITAEAREANPSIKVIPVGSSDVELASVYEGLIRHLEQKCDAANAYQQQMWYAAAAGEGYLLLDSEYIDADSFDQDLVISGASNPAKVFLDPLHELLDGCDAEWGFIIEDLSVDDYKRRFPRSKLTEKLNNVTSTNGWQALSLPGDWLNQSSVRVAKYFVKDYTDKTIYQVYDPVKNEEYVSEEKPDDTKIVLRKRVAQVCKVKRYVLNALEVLDESDWPSKYLPIIKVTGDTFAIGGQRVQYGAIRHAKDSQRQYNYLVSRQTQLIDMAPKSPFIGATGQFANNAEKWANSNVIPFGFLDYTPVVEGGIAVPPPQKVSGVDVGTLQAIAATRGSAYEDIKLVFGLNDASLGRPGNEISGIAIQERNSASRKSTYQYFDNLLVAMRCLGRQLVELIPSFYDTDRIVRIVKPDTSEELIAINSISNNYRYNMTKGTFDVVVETGPAFANKRQQSLQALQGIMGVLPESSQVIGDLVASMVDSPIAKVAAKRIKATIPPNILAATGEDDQEDMAPAEMVNILKQQLAQLQMEVEKADLEKQELELRVKVAEDKTAMELTKSDMEHQRELMQLQHQQEVAEAEVIIKKKQLELTERKLALEEKKLELAAAGKLGDLMLKDDVSIPSEANIGGKLD